jgi:3-deoxy-7-phosphoheptulonate synthase
MLVVMDGGATAEETDFVVAELAAIGLVGSPIYGIQQTTIGVSGSHDAFDAARIEQLPGVKEVIPVTRSYKLVTRDAKASDTSFSVGGVTVGGTGLVVIAGPCAIESLDQARAIAESAKEAGAQLFRGGAFKPRSSPYSFQGLGEQGLEILARIREEFALPVVTEAVDQASLDLVVKYADAVQVGARNMHNFSLLRSVGRCGKPVLLKRGFAATLEEFLLSAEYILAEGNPDVMLCERGVRTFSDYTRNTLDLAVIPAVKRLSHLPILVDPSHGTGKRGKVLPMARAGIAAGADGVLVEVHHAPEEALSDGPQAILPDELRQLMYESEAIGAILGRTMQPSLTAAT